MIRHDLIVWQVWKIESKPCLIFQPAWLAHVHPGAIGFNIPSTLSHHILSSQFASQCSRKSSPLLPPPMIHHPWPTIHDTPSITHHPWWSRPVPPILIVCLHVLQKESDWLSKPSDVPVTKNANIGHCSENTKAVDIQMFYVPIKESEHLTLFW